MTIQIYNTMEKNKVEFVPRDAGKVGMYVCGPTVYNYIHLGNARPIVVFDAVRRYFKYAGYDVTYVQNFTDVDDKIINRANEEGVKPEEITKKYIAAYMEDVKALNVLEADVHPTVTGHDPECIENLANDEAFAKIKEELKENLFNKLKETNDPRLNDFDYFDRFEYVGDDSHSWKAYAEGRWIKQTF